MYALLRRMAGLTPFLPPFFPSPEISSFLRTSITITSFGIQKVLSTPVGKKYLIGSPLLPRSSGSRSSPDISFALSFSLVSGRCFRTYVLTTFLIFRKLAGMLLLLTLTLTILLQRNTRLFLFPLQLLSLPLWH